ncbi:class II fumarate hydratase [Thiocapsa roseopersicina]|uniref:fumarate hydratase n=1 Tax=Thiocapsa roseopersicina TaxID=1058 RepID=A0A1H2ZKZ9_THIRO|nr:class II fumarate hydratase [Thiocapsa roseopersicina]SDX18065.1 fumarase, class II [Thiocapsa roseopersicina]
MSTEKYEHPDPSVENGHLYGRQTRLALDNFAIGGRPLPPAFIQALGLIKACAARVNGRLGVVSTDLAEAIEVAAQHVAAGELDDQFPVDIYQTGSGTSSNMNANEVIATLASRALGRTVHPNDDVNRGQSSNDVIPTAIHVAAALALPALRRAVEDLAGAIERRADAHRSLVKTGRTHLMDAVPLTLGQEFGGWAAQLRTDLERLDDTARRLLKIAQGGTAVGTGVNTHPRFAETFAAELSHRTGLAFAPADDLRAAIAGQDTAVELSGQLRVLALTLMKIANDLRWMASGPAAGLAEIRLPALQAGSSIMPGKVNPVIPEAVAMACVQVVGLDTAIALAAQDNRFQLCTMLPLIAADLLEQIGLLTRASGALGEKAIDGLGVNAAGIKHALERNTMLATALAPVIGYDAAAAIARRALDEDRPVREIAREDTDLADAELDRLLDPRRLAGLTD